jgi:hypothetical protein
VSYLYSNHRAFVFTEAGQAKLLNTLAKARHCIEVAGAVRAGILLSAASTDTGGNSWDCMAIVERLVELGYLELHPCASHRAWQDEVYVAGGKRFP